MAIDFERYYIVVCAKLVLGLGVYSFIEIRLHISSIVVRALACQGILNYAQAFVDEAWKTERNWSGVGLVAC